jgi:hypothetical protein
MSFVQLGVWIIHGLRHELLSLFFRQELDEDGSLPAIQKALRG